MEENLYTTPTSSANQQILVQKIEIRLDKNKCPDLPADQLEDLRQLLSTKWNLLCHSLGVELAIEVKVNFRNKPKAGMGDLPPITVSLDGEDLEFPYLHALPEPLTFSWLKERFSEFILLSRESLLSPLFLNASYAKWDGNSKFSQEEFCTLAKLYVRHGFALDTLFATAKSSPHFDIHTLFEHNFEDFGAPTLTLCLPPSVKPRTIKRISENFLQQINRTFSYQMGISIPNFQVRTEKELVDGVYQFQINVLRWPQKNGDPLEQTQSLLDFLKSQAACFIHLRGVEHLLERLKEVHPDLLAIVLRNIDLPFLTQLLRQLTWERIPVRNLAFILETFLEEERKISIVNPSNFHLLPYQWNAHHVNAKHAYKENDLFLIKERIRSRLCREVFNTFKSTNGSLEVFTLGEEFEKALFEMEPGVIANIKESITHKLRQYIPERASFLLLVAPEFRLMLQDILFQRFPNLHVLSFQEIPANGQIDVLGSLHFLTQQEPLI
jgi:hypothetical protein